MQLMLGFGQNRQEGASSEAVIAYYTRMKLHTEDCMSAQIAHIVAFSPDGPRGDRQLSHYKK